MNDEYHNAQGYKFKDKTSQTLARKAVDLAVEAVADGLSEEEAESLRRRADEMTARLIEHHINNGNLVPESPTGRLGGRVRSDITLERARATCERLRRQ